MPFGSLFRSLNCASSRSSEIQRRATLSRKKSHRKSKKENQNTNDVVGPSAPQSSENIQDLSELVRKASLAPNPISFWEIGNYKYTLQRCDNGYKLGSDFADMISDRAKIEENYAKSLRQWFKEWNEHLNTKSTEFDASKNGWLAFLEAGNKTAEIHSDLCKNLINNPVLKIKDWLKKKYEKHLINFKQTKDFENQFVAAERSWVTLNDKLKKNKKEYYESVKTTKQSEEAVKSSQSNPKITQDQRDKLEEKLKKAKEDEIKARKQYNDTLIEMDLYKPRHMELMKDVFEKTQNFECERIMFFKQILAECHEMLQIHNDERFDILFKQYIENLNSIDPKDDLEVWSQCFGVDTKPVWPAFEEYHSQ